MTIHTRAIASATLILLCAQLAAAQSAMRVSCLPDKVMATRGETIGVNVWVASDAGVAARSVDARWHATAGMIAEASPAAHWQLGVVVDRKETATVDVIVDGRSAGSCSFDVWVMPPIGDARRRGEYLPQGAFLRTGQTGEPGYGLYSYFLLREPATSRDKARAASFVTAFVDDLAGIADLDAYVERRKLNGAYLPVTGDLPRGLLPAQRREWAIEHYDYEQAKRLLSLYPALTGPGPFIIAVPSPLRTQVKPMLPWDFNQIDAANIADGVNRFLNQAAQLYDWQNQSTLQKLRDQLLTTVAGMFVGRASAEGVLQIVR